MKYSIGYKCYKSIEPKLSTVPKIINILLGMGIEPVYVNRGDEMGEDEFMAEMRTMLMLYTNTVDSRTYLDIPGMDAREILVESGVDQIKFTNAV